MVPLLNERLKYYPFYLCPNKFGASNLEQRNFFQEQIPLRGRKVFLSPALSIEKLGEKSWLKYWFSSLSEEELLPSLAEPF